MRDPVKCGISVTLVTLPITLVSAFAIVGSQLGVRDDPHGVGAFVVIAFSFILGVSFSLAMGIIVGLVLNRRLDRSRNR